MSAALLGSNVMAAQAATHDTGPEPVFALVQPTSTCPQAVVGGRLLRFQRNRFATRP